METVGPRLSDNATQGHTAAMPPAHGMVQWVQRVVETYHTTMYLRRVPHGPEELHARQRHQVAGAALRVYV